MILQQIFILENILWDILTGYGFGASNNKQYKFENIYH